MGIKVQIGDIIMKKDDEAAHHFRVIDRQSAFFTLQGLVAGKVFHVRSFDVQYLYEIVGKDWPTPLGTSVRQRLSRDDDLGYETWSHAYTVVEHRQGPDDAGGELICVCLGEDIGGEMRQLFYIESALRDDEVRIEALAVRRKRLGRRLEL